MKNTFNNGLSRRSFLAAAGALAGLADPQDALSRLVDTSFLQASGGNEVDDEVDRAFGDVILIGGLICKYEQVDAGTEAASDRLLKTVVLRDSTHAHVVRDDDAVESQLVAQQATDRGQNTSLFLI